MISTATDGGLAVDRGMIDPAPIRLATQNLKTALAAGNTAEIQRSVATLAVTLPVSGGQGLTAADKQDVLLTLDAAATYADKKNNWSLLEIILSVLALGIPFLVDALHTSDAERVLANYKSLRAKTDAHWLKTGQFRHESEGDISGYMNLYVGNPLQGATTAMAKAFGGEFQMLADHTATNTYSKGGTVDPADFEVSAGVVLIDKATRRIVSQESDGRYVLYTLDGRPAFKGNDGKFFFEPSADRAPEEIPAARVSALQKTSIADRDVGARFRMPTDGPAREKMSFVWHGYDKSSGPQDVSWWGQCHASGMLGAMGVPPATENVTFYDEKTKKTVELSSDQVTNLLVLLGDLNFQTADRPDYNGGVNPSKETLDSDTPVGFHTFVARQIAAGMPFNLESYSYDQIWNYPVGGASIKETGSAQSLPDGNKKQRYEMILTETNGDQKKYYYFLTSDTKGNVIASEWDLKACEEANGKNAAVPDMTTAYMNASRSSQQLTAGSYEARESGLTADGARLISDLYFAAVRKPMKNEGRVYAVRKADGTLVQMTEAELTAYRRDH